SSSCTRPAHNTNLIAAILPASSTSIALSIVPYFSSINAKEFRVYLSFLSTPSPISITTGSLFNFLILAIIYTSILILYSTRQLNFLEPCLYQCFISISMLSINLVFPRLYLFSTDFVLLLNLNKLTYNSLSLEVDTITLSLI